MTDRTPALRDETPAERRLKRQLRRYISLLAYADYETERQFPRRFYWDRWNLLWRQNLTIFAYRFSLARIVSKSPQEVILGNVYADIKKAIMSARFEGIDKHPSRYFENLATRAKQALYATRRDKDKPQ